MSIGIIGGADGPTAIFIANKAICPLPLGIIIVMAVALITFFIWRKKNKQGV